MVYSGFYACTNVWFEVTDYEQVLVPMGLDK